MISPVFLATPVSWGNGIVFKGHDLIVCPLNVVKNFFEIFCFYKNLEFSAQVYFKDSINNLAFLKPKIYIDFEGIPLDKVDIIYFRDSLYAHSVDFLGNLTTKKISDFVNLATNESHLIEISQNLMDGAIITGKNDDFKGIIINKNDKTYILTLKYVITIWEEFIFQNNKQSIRCFTCGKIVSLDSIHNNVCPICNTNMDARFADVYMYLTQQPYKYFVDNGFNVLKIGKNFVRLTNDGFSVFLNIFSKAKSAVLFKIFDLPPNINLKSKAILENIFLNEDFLYVMVKNKKIYLTTPILPFDAIFAIDLKEMFTNFQKKTQLLKSICDEND